MRPAIFFDRDGTLNVEVGYAGSAERFHLFDFAPEAVRRANQAGYAAVVLTNQAGVARGYYDEAAVAALHELLIAKLAAEGAVLDGIYYCPHHPDFGVERDCDCRKPKPGMVRRAERDLGLDLTRSWIIGDRRADIELGHAVGAHSALVLTGYGRQELQKGFPEHPPHLVAENVLEAVEAILAPASVAALESSHREPGEGQP